MSTIFRKTFANLKSLDDILKNYDEAEDLKFQQMHQILILDKGRSEILKIIDNINM